MNLQPLKRLLMKILTLYCVRIIQRPYLPPLDVHINPLSVLKSFYLSYHPMPLFLLLLPSLPTVPMCCNSAPPYVHTNPLNVHPNLALVIILISYHTMQNHFQQSPCAAIPHPLCGGIVHPTRERLQWASVCKRWVTITHRHIYIHKYRKRRIHT